MNQHVNTGDLNSLNGITSMKGGIQAGSSSRMKVNTGLSGIIAGHQTVDDKRSNSVSNNPAYTRASGLDKNINHSVSNLASSDHYQIT